jgi:hypothetical protein
VWEGFFSFHLIVHPCAQVLVPLFGGVGVGGGWVGFGQTWLGMLLGPEKTSCVVFFRVAPAVDRLTPACGVWVVVVVGGGVWLFVECCIVDASILLW